MEQTGKDQKRKTLQALEGKLTLVDIDPLERPVQPFTLALIKDRKRGSLKKAGDDYIIKVKRSFFLDNIDAYLTRRQDLENPDHPQVIHFFESGCSYKTKDYVEAWIQYAHFKRRLDDGGIVNQEFAVTVRVVKNWGVVYKHIYSVFESP